MGRKRLLGALACLLMLCGCGVGQGGMPSENGPAQQVQGKPAPQGALELRLLQREEDGQWLLAGESGVFTFCQEEIPFYTEGGEQVEDPPQAGQMVQAACGEILETWPARLEEVQGVWQMGWGEERFPNVWGLYLQVLRDLVAKSPALAEGIEYVNVDLSGAPGGLTPTEQQALAWCLGNDWGAQPLTLTQQQLEEEGYLSDPMEGWNSGLLLIITGRTTENASQEAGIEFEATAWRGPLAAYYFDGCTAWWPKEGSWTSYAVGQEAIS